MGQALEYLQRDLGFRLAIELNLVWMDADLPGELVDRLGDL